MRARDRARAEATIRGMLSTLPPGATCDLVWARALPPNHDGAAFFWNASTFWLMLSESRPADLDTLAHECAHVLAWARHGTAIQPHGREWRRVFRALTAGT